MLKNRNFLLLWLINLTTTLAIELFTVSILVTIFEQTESTLQAAGTMVVRTLPAFLLGPLAGSFVDRFPRKNVLLAMDIARLILIGVAVWTLQGRTEIPVLGTYLILLGLSAADVLHRPARMAIIPMIMPQEKLVQANSFIFVSLQVVVAFAYIIGSWMAQTLTIAQTSLSIVVAFVLAILFASLINISAPVSETGEEQEQDSIWRSFVAGWHYLRKHDIARPLTIMETVEHVPHGIWTGALLLTFIIQGLGGSSVEWGYLVTGYLAGMTGGSLISYWSSAWLGRYPGWIIVATAAASGFMTLAFAYSPNIGFAVFMGLVFGLPFAIRDVAQDSLLQSTVEEGQLGRVYATREMLRSVVFMFSGIGFAWLSSYVEIRQIYVIGGILYILTGIYALSNKPLRESHMLIAESG